jgi:hypothetical protein
MAWSKLVDMELSDEEIADQQVPVMPAEQPKYPWGLCIRLTEKELDKLGLLEDEPEVGDYIDLRAFARVTSYRKESMENGNECRCVELQIEKLALENEDREDVE